MNCCTAAPFATALADAVAPPEYDQLRHGQPAQALQHDRFRQCGYQVQPQNQLSVHGDDAGRLTRIDHQEDSATTLDDFDYVYDDVGRVTKETSDLGPTRDYEYDDAGQLTSDGADDWTFDKNGNRTMSGFVTDDGNRLVSDGAWNYQYDDEGNVIRKVEGVTGEMWVYAYNHLNQLIEAEHDPDGQSGVDLRVNYTYDVFGNRIVRAVDGCDSGR